jgi:RND superfamily putative drug exporter
MSDVNRERRSGGWTRAVTGRPRLTLLLALLFTALAVVMVAIGTSRVANTKMLGLGIGLAVLMDAMVVRTLLVPAVMRLTGLATWWAPPVLRRFHARFGISEGDGSAAHGRPGVLRRPEEHRDPEPAARS